MRDCVEPPCRNGSFSRPVFFARRGPETVLRLSHRAPSLADGACTAEVRRALYTDRRDKVPGVAGRATLQLAGKKAPPTWHGAQLCQLCLSVAYGMHKASMDVLKRWTPWVLPYVGGYQLFPW